MCASLFWSTGMKAKLRKDLFCQTFPKRMFHPPSQLGHQEETELEKFVRLLFTPGSIWGTTFPSKAQFFHPGHNLSIWGTITFPSGEQLPLNMMDGRRRRDDLGILTKGKMKRKNENVYSSRIVFTQ